MSIALNLVCSKCGEEKNVGEFRRDRALKNGYSRWCKECILPGERERRRKNAPQRKKQREYRRAQKLKEVTSKEPIVVKPSPRLPNSHSAENLRRRRAILAGIDAGAYTTAEVISLYGDACYLCGEKINLSISGWTGSPGWQRALHLDHVIPLSKGGLDTIDNIRPTHGQCNSKKRGKII